MAQRYYDFILEHGAWSVLIALMVIVGCLVGIQHWGAVQRRKRFSKRRAMSEHEWFEALYPIPEDARDSTMKVLRAFGDEIGIEWTKLRPTDAFEDVLRVDRRCSPHDDLEEAELEITLLAKELGIADQELPGFTGNLKDFLGRWVALCSSPSPRATCR